MAQIPFTIHIRVVPTTGKRFESIRDLQKISVAVLEELDDSLLSLASPGGGQHRAVGSFVGHANGTAIKPQIGASPAQLQITGFYDDSGVPEQAHADIQVVHTNSSQSGPAGGNTWNQSPNSQVDDNVKAIRTLFDAALSKVLGSTDWRIFRLEVSGKVYGDRGLHFPR